MRKKAHRDFEPQASAAALRINSERSDWIEGLNDLLRVGTDVGDQKNTWMMEMCVSRR